MSSWTRVDHLGHTTFRLSVPELTILIDPVLVQPDLRFGDRRVPEWWFPDGEHVDAIFISHAHSDHLHPPTLLGFPADTPVFGYEKSAGKLERLGFTNITTLNDDSVIRLNEQLTMRVVPVVPSAEGTLQCGFLVETPDATILDLVDARDSERTRTALASLRGLIDLAFVPAGVSIQWAGYWNQMDPLSAARFAEWLGAAAVAPCGGTLSAHAPRSRGSLQRYPTDRADWFETASKLIAADKLIAWKTPFSLIYIDHQPARKGPVRPTNFSAQARLFETQALVSTFFSGFDLLAPVRELRSESLDTFLAAWKPARVAIRETNVLLAKLVERCLPAANATPAARLAPRTLRRLRKAEQFQLAGSISSLFPEAADPVNLALGFFDAVETLIRSDAGINDQLRLELLICIGMDRALYDLEREAREMKQAVAARTAESIETLRDQHLEQLSAEAEWRRPVLSVNHLSFSQSETALLFDETVAPDVHMTLAVATPEGVKFVMLRESEAHLLRQCDGRTLAEISADLSRPLNIDQDTALNGLVELLLRLSRISVHLIDWSA